MKAIIGVRENRRSLTERKSKKLTIEDNRRSLPDEREIAVQIGEEQQRALQFLASLLIGELFTCY